jgi:hypothetical protein
MSCPARSQPLPNNSTKTLRRAVHHICRIRSATAQRLRDMLKRSSYGRKLFDQQLFCSEHFLASMETHLQTLRTTVMMSTDLRANVNCSQSASESQVANLVLMSLLNLEDPLHQLATTEM